MQTASAEERDAAFAWRSVHVSRPGAADGEVVVSLNPTSPSGEPLIYLPASGKVVKVAPYVLSDGSTTLRFELRELGLFHMGIAPARLEVMNDAANASVQRATLWGYVNAQGQWVIQALFSEASHFVGDVALALPVLQDGTKKLRLIDRRGQFLEWEPIHQSQTQAHFTHSISSKRLARVGRWTLITDVNHSGQHSHLTDGQQVRPVPGVNAMHSPDGELWLLQTDQGARLWRPEGGFVSVPEGRRPSAPLSSELYVAPASTSGGSAIFHVSGRVVAEVPGFGKALTSSRFIACDAPVSDPVFSAYDLSRHLGEAINRYRCGILDAQGAWWMQPKFRTVDPWGEHLVLMQGADDTAPCLVDLRQVKAECLRTERPLPTLSTGTDRPRSYRYTTWLGNGGVKGSFRLAWPFAGQIAEVMDRGLPALIDAEGRLLTPGPEGDLISQSHQRAVVQPLMGGTDRGQGVIDRQGAWVVPAVFGHLTWNTDGTLRACMPGTGLFEIACERLSPQGRSLGQSQNLPSTLPPSLSASKASASATLGSGPVAVARDGLWGFQVDGAWVIQPQFDDADDFYGDRAPAAMLLRSKATEVDPSPEATMRWGLIDRQGKWVLPAQFEEMQRFQGEVAAAKKQGLWGLINRNGKWLSAPEFEEIGLFEMGLAVAKRSRDEICLMRSDGSCLDLPGLLSVTRTDGDWALGQQSAASGVALWGYLDMKEQAWAITPQFITASPFKGEWAIASSELPPATPEASQLWITVRVQRHLHAGLTTVGAVRPVRTDWSAMQTRQADTPTPSITNSVKTALVDDQGRWLTPQPAR
ncbi:MAG: WG repeat-containing protein [Rhizobacter sp.]